MRFVILQIEDVIEFADKSADFYSSANFHAKNNVTHMAVVTSHKGAFAGSSGRKTTTVG